MGLLAFRLSRCKQLSLQLMFALMEAVFGAENLDQQTFNSGLDTLRLVT